MFLDHLNFSDQLFQKIEKKKSPLCVGLDPHFDLIPDPFKKGKTPPEAILSFLLEILPAISKYCPCIKPNLAFFEIWGYEGWLVLEKVCEQAKKLDLLVIADAKRSDVGSTAEKYAEAFLGKTVPYDAITISPYLGQDGIIPFAEIAQKNDKGVFVLVKTSNKSSGEFQDLPVGDCLLHEEVARAVSRLSTDSIGESGFSSLGAVVGATHPDDISILRSEMPAQVFLIPGYGVQGGNAQDVASAFYKGGRGAVVNSSRGILFASGRNDVAKNAAEAAKKAKEELWTVANTKK